MVEYSVDRIVGQTAVLIDENGKTKEISLPDLPSEVQENDILIFDGSSYQIDFEKKRDKKMEVQQLIDSFFQ